MSQRCSILQLVLGSGFQPRIPPFPAGSDTSAAGGRLLPIHPRRPAPLSLLAPAPTPPAGTRAQLPARRRQRRDAGPIRGRITPFASPYRQRGPGSRSRDTSVCGPPHREGEGRRLGPPPPRGPRAEGREADSIAVPAAGRPGTGLSAAAESPQHVHGRARGPPANSAAPPAAAGSARGSCPSGGAQGSCPAAGAGGRGCRGPRHRRAEGGREGAGGGCPRPGRTADSRTHLPDWGSPQQRGRALPRHRGLGVGVRGAASLAPPGSLGGRAERSRRRRGGDKGGWMAGGRVCGGRPMASGSRGAGAAPRGSVRGAGGAGRGVGGAGGGSLGALQTIQPGPSCPEPALAKMAAEKERK